MPVSAIRPLFVVALAAATAVALACTSPAPSGPFVGQAGITSGLDAAKDTGSADSAAATDLPKPATADVKGADLATSADGGGGGGCTCAGIECGSPPDCPNAPACGGCPKGAMCQNNACVADPGCSCAGYECGILEGCGKDCGTCTAPATCIDNVCEVDCSCATIECGQPPGCKTDCGACTAGKLCSDNICKPDPKCVCKQGMCGVPPGCAQNCGACPTGEQCLANKCTAGGSDCPCSGIACGYAKPSCAKSCGSCQINQICSDNQCKTVSSTTKKKFGEPCGPSDECPVPPPGAGYFQQKKFIECQHNQCEGALCFANVCSKKCKIGQDTVNNNTGANGPDGIEDPGQPSGCGGAAVGPSGGGFKCIEQNSPAQVLAGQTDQICLPGAALTPCQADTECPAGEICRIYPMVAGFQARCGPKISNPIGTAGVKGSQACNLDPTAGPVAMCETGWCAPFGCVALCKSDADCKTLPGGCKSGQCFASGKVCATDAECPVWKCNPAATFSESSTIKFSACQPGP